MHRIGFANGVFDLLHLGHIHFLRQCLHQCDYLIVAVNSDVSVKRLKGLSRPRETLQQRMTALRPYVDAVIPFDGYEEGLIVHIKPQIFFRGSDHSIDVTAGSPQVANGIGCAIVQISHLPGYSTTGLINEAKFDASTSP
jgi:rfaE bifunctional protein nucleotidyltransferase chain/domain